MAEKELAPDSGTAGQEWLDGYEYDETNDKFTITQACLVDLEDAGNTPCRPLSDANAAVTSGDIRAITASILERLYQVQEYREGQSSTDVLDTFAIIKTVHTTTSGGVTEVVTDYKIRIKAALNTSTLASE